MATPSPPAPTGGGDVAAPTAHIRRQRPRLLVDADFWDTLRDTRQRDAGLDGLLVHLGGQADLLLDVAAVTYHKIGRRLLDVSREALRRNLLLSFVYRLTGDGRYLRRVEAEALAVCGFDNWNAGEVFLDAAEMAVGLAFVYDWLFDDLTPATRGAIRGALVRNTLTPPLPGPGEEPVWFLTCRHNWNSVSYAGGVLGSLALVDEEPELARRWLALAAEHNAEVLRCYGPNGVYPEGPMYWHYGTSFQVLLIEALRHATGGDLGLSDDPGFAGFVRSGAFMLHAAGPTGRMFNYADGREVGDESPVFGWFAREAGLDELARLHVRPPWPTEMVSARLLPLAAVWWPGLDGSATPGAAEALPTAYHGTGEVPLATFRTAWDDPDAAYLATAGGSPGRNHGHMDGGGFVYEAHGVRWAIDLGRQDYHSLESRGVKIWDREQSSDRWRVFRLNNHSHNVLTLDGQLHRVDGHAAVTGFCGHPAASWVTYDLTPLFGDQAPRVTRGFTFGAEGAVRVQDELDGLTPGTAVRWTMMTRAAVEVGGGEATLRQDGQSLRLSLVEPGDVAMTATPLGPQAPYDEPNPGLQRIDINLTAPASGTLRIAVDLLPQAHRARGEDGPGGGGPVRPLGSWHR